MVEVKQMGGFRGVSLQASLVKEVEDFIVEVPFYRSVAEFVSEAIRLRLEQLKKDPEKEGS